MSSIHFPYRPRDDDPRAALVVQRNLNYLGDLLNSFGENFDHGTGIVLPGNTTQNILFSKTMPNPSVIATPSADPGVRWWVANKNPTGFAFTLQTPAGPGGVPFDWVVRGGT